MEVWLRLPLLGWIRVILKAFCTIIARVFNAEFLEERIIPKTFYRSFEFMLNIWDLTNILFSSDRACTPLDQFGKLDLQVSNHINPFLSVKLWLFLPVFYLKANRLETHTTSKQPEIGEFWSITGALHITTQRTARKVYTLNFLLAIFQCV